MKSRISIAEVSAKLSDQIESVCTLLLPAGKKRGNIIEVGSIHGEEGKTLKVNLSGSFQGHWVDWNGSEHKGDPLDLWAKVRNVQLPEALRQAKEWLGIREPELPKKTWAKPSEEKPALKADGSAMQWLVTKRKLDPELVNRYKVKGDAAKKAIVFPSYSPSGELINHSYRTLDAEKRVWQDKECAPCLFGWHALSDKPFAAREILISEGQIDAITWAQWGIEALSLPNGSGMSWVEYEWENLEVFKTIYLAFDMDPAGRKMTEDAVARLGKHRCRIVQMTHKDANDALIAGITAEEARGWLEKSEYANVPHIVLPSAFADKVADVFFPTGEYIGHALPQTVHDDPELTFRFRPGELTLWTGVSSHGKSTLLNSSLCYLAGKTRRPSFVFSFEMQPAKVIRRVVLSMGAKIANGAEAKEAARQMDKWILFCDLQGTIEKAALFDLIHYAYARYNIGHVGIDSLMRIRGLEENYPAQNEFVTELAEFAHQTGVHIHLVAHPNKSSGHASPEAHNIKGSGHIRDNADNILVVWRNREKEKDAEAGDNVDDRPDSILKIEKDREDGSYREFPLTFHRSNYSYSKFSAPPPKEKPKNVTKFRKQYPAD